MNAELTQEELKQVRKQCKEQGIVPVINLSKEDLRLTEVKRLNMLERDLEQDKRYSSLTELAAYLTECPHSAINVLGSTVQRCKIIFGLSKEEADGIIRAFSLSFYNERFVVPNAKREEADISPYTERGLAGFDQMNPWSPMKRRKSYFKSHHTESKSYE